MRRLHKALLALAAICCTGRVNAIDTPTPNAQPSSNNPNTFASFANNVGDVVKDFGDDVEELLDHYSAFAGKLFPILSKFYIPPSKARQIFKEIKTVADLGEWIMLIMIGWATVPLIKYPYERIGATKRKIGFEKDSIKKNDEGNEIEKPKIPFENTFLFQLSNHVAEAGKIALLVYIIDCFFISIKTMGFGIERKYSQLAAKGIYTSWIFSRLLRWKRFFVRKAVYATKKGNREGKKNRAKIANAITDILVLVVGGFFLVDILKVNIGVTLKSVYALGGVGTLLTSFASKDVAMALVGGLALQASDKLFEGDTVRLSNGIEGRVDQIGMMETVITDANEMVMTIPNKQLSESRVINISRIKYSRIQQDIHFHYEDCHKLPMILDEIKREISSTCPMVVSDGSKPLRAYFKSYGNSFLEVEVDVRLRCQPGGEDFKKARQEVLLAIDRAVRRNNVKFAVVKEI